MKHVFAIILFLLLLFTFRDQQFIEWSAVKFDIKEIKSNIVWYNSGEGQDWYPLSESSSRFCYEDGLIDILPNYQAMFAEYIEQDSSFSYFIEFPDGNTFTNQEKDVDVCIYLKEVETEIEYINPVKKLLKTRMKGVLDLDSFYNRDYDSEYYKGVLFETEMELTGIYSQAYLDYKVKEIWIHHLSDVLNFHLDPWKGKRKDRRRAPTQNAELTKG